MSRPGSEPPFVWIDGQLTGVADAQVPLRDRGARDGQGVFETVRVYRGRPFAWERHLERLVVSAAELGFPVAPDPRLLGRALSEVLAANGLEEAAARLTMTRGIAGRRPTRAGVWVEAEPIGGRLWRGTRRQGARVMLSGPPFEPGLLGRHKTMSRLAYQLAREEARAAHADEALLVHPSAGVLEGAVSNVFVALGDTLVTPPLSANILPGITRRIVLELCAVRGWPVEERPLGAEELTGVEEMFLTNSLQEIVPVARLGDRELPSRDRGIALIGDYRARVRRELDLPVAPDDPL